MTAFLIDSRSDPAAKIAVPSGPGEQVSEPLVGDIHVTYRKSGDVSVARTQGTALLVWGYISHAPGVSLGADPTHNATILLKRLDRLATVNEVGSFVEKCAGSFGLVYVDRSGKLLSITDRWASRPLWRNPSGTLIASHVLPLAHAAREKRLNHSAIASVLLYGAPMIPQNSLFSEVRSQAPGTIIEKAGSDESESVWFRFSHSPNHGRSSKEWACLAAARLKTSAERILQLGTRPGLFLSGGLDSRVAAAAFVAAGGRPHMISLTDQENLESRVARLVAKTLSCSHSVLFRDDEHYLRALRASALSSNGNFSWIHSHFSEAYTKIAASEGLDWVAIGDLAEAFTKLVTTTPLDRTTMWSPAEFVEELDDLLLDSYKPKDRIATLALMNTDVKEAAVNSLRHQLMERYETISATSSEPAIVADQMIRWDNLSTCATYQMFFDLRSAAPERNVMFDPDVHDLFLELPAQERAGKRLGARILRELHLPAALAPDANSLVPVMGHEKLHKFSKEMRPRLGKLRRRFVSNDYTTTASWPHLPLLMQKEEPWKKEIMELLLEGDYLSADIWDRKAIEERLGQFFAGDTALHQDVEHLTSLAAFFRAAQQS